MSMPALMRRAQRPPRYGARPAARCPMLRPSAVRATSDAASLMRVMLRAMRFSIIIAQRRFCVAARAFGVPLIDIFIAETSCFCH